MVQVLVLPGEYVKVQGFQPLRILDLYCCSSDSFCVNQAILRNSQIVMLIASQ